MRIRNSFVLYVSLLALMISMTAMSAQATFSNASLKGGYSVLINRWTGSSSDAESALLGVMTFDGAGKVTLSFTIMSDGVESTGNASGTYSISGNGSGTIAFTSGLSNEVDFDIVVESTASGLSHGITLLRTDSNYPSDSVDAGNAVLQSTTPVTYTLASVNGNFTLQFNKWTVVDTQEGAVGVVTFNGSGSWKATVADRSNGVTTTKNFSGNYTVNSDGSGSMTGSNHPLAFVLNNVVSGHAKGAQFLQAGEDSGTNQVHTGVALKQ